MTLPIADFRLLIGNGPAAQLAIGNWQLAMNYV